MLYENLFERIISAVQGRKANEDINVDKSDGIDDWKLIDTDIAPAGDDESEITEFYFSPKTGKWAVDVAVAVEKEFKVVDLDQLKGEYHEDYVEELINKATKAGYMGGAVGESKVNEAGEGKTFTLKVSMNNDTFVDDPARELTRVLRNAADQVIHGEMNVDAGDSKNLKDVNGNTVGEMRIVVGPSSTKYED
jgi:hypothetical protein